MKAKLLSAVPIAALAGLLAAQDDGRLQRSFDVGDKGRVELSAQRGDLTIRIGGAGKVVIEGEGLDVPERNLLLTQEGNVIRAQYRSGWGGGRARFRVTVPPDFDLELETSGGEIQVSGNLKGILSARTSGGDVEAGDIGGEADVATSGGDIELGAIGGSARARSSGGDVNVSSTEGDLLAATSGGDIVAGDVKGGLRARTAGGEIRAGQVSGAADVKTAGGDIEVGGAGQGADLSTAGGNIVLGPAQGRVSASTAGGDIFLRNVQGAIRARTTGGDIEARLEPSGDAPSVLRTNVGNVLLTIAASAKATIEARLRNVSRELRESGQGVQIQSDFEAESRRESRGEIVAVYQLNGGGPHILLEASQGRIEIRKPASP